jgi:hypothetical protein
MRDTSEIRKKEALHAIMRLKAGLSPDSCIESLTVNLSEQQDFLGQFLQNRSSNVGVVVGPYGSGKTHFLQLTKRLALKAGYLLTSAGQETGLGILSFPHRHSSVMIGGLRGEAPIGRLLDHAASAIDADPRAFLTTARVISPHADGRTRFLDQLEVMLTLGPVAGRTVRVLDFLSGRTLAGQAGTIRDRLKAYELLAFWVAYGQEITNFSGLVIIIDEFESLFSTALYSSIRSRRTAYRSLAYYASMGHHVRILLALTPDGWKGLQDDIHGNAQYMSEQASVLGGEDVPVLLRMLRKVRPHELRSMSDRHYKELQSKIVTLHAEAREYMTTGGEEIQAPRGVGVTPRVFSRSIVSALESTWLKSLTTQD